MIDPEFPESEIIYEDKKLIKSLGFEENSSGNKWLVINHIGLDAQKLKTIRLHENEVVKLIAFWQKRVKNEPKS